MTSCTTITPPYQYFLAHLLLCLFFFYSLYLPFYIYSPLQTSSTNNNYSLYSYYTFNNLFFT